MNHGRKLVPMQIPQRSSLVAQAAERLREGIHNGEWSQRLPSEVALCNRLQVSRRTLRAALAVLERESFIKVRYGKGRDICAPSKRRNRPVSHVIGVWYLPPAPIITAAGGATLNALRIHLEAAGYEMAVVNAAPNGEASELRSNGGKWWPSMTRRAGSSVRHQPRFFVGSGSRRSPRSLRAHGARRFICRRSTLTFARCVAMPRGCSRSSGIVA